jgi:hypothetical protein
MRPSAWVARVVLLGSLLAGLPLGAGAVHVVAHEERPLELTPQERAWIEAHPVIRVGNDPSWMPIDFDDEHGLPTGVAADILALLAARLGLRFEAAPGQTWERRAVRAGHDGAAEPALRAGA